MRETICDGRVTSGVLTTEQDTQSIAGTCKPVREKEPFNSPPPSRANTRQKVPMVTISDSRKNMPSENPDMIKEDSLSTVFKDCYFFYVNRIAERPMKDEKPTQELILEFCHKLSVCDEWIDQLGCFSENESVEDISTASLKYLLVPFLHGELLQALNDLDRLPALQSIITKMKVFCLRLEKLGLVNKDDALLFDGTAIDSATRRSLKVSRFKQQKELSGKLNELRKRFSKHSKLDDGSKSVLGNWNESMDEEEREGWLLEINMALRKAMDTLDSLQRELDMLKAASSLESFVQDKDLLAQQSAQRQKSAEQWHQSARQRALTGSAKPAAPISCATFAQDVIEGRAAVSQKHTHHRPAMGFGPVSLMKGGAANSGVGATFREAVAAQVFQPSHSLPGMSIEQAGDHEVRMMRAMEERMAASAAEALKQRDNADRAAEGEGDEGSEYKAREWDDWKDDNPKGKGNSKLTPCG